MRRRLPQGVRMYTGDDFNYAELIAGDAQGYSDALLGIFDAIAPAASAALGALHARRRSDVPRHPGADGAAVAPHLQGADPLLQDRRGVHGLSQRPAGSFHHGRRPGERALDAASRRAVPPRRRRRAACRSGAAPPRACALRAWRVRGRRSPDARPRRTIARWLAINSATVKAWSLRAAGRRLRARRHLRDRAVARHRAGAAGVERAGKLIRAHGLTVTCLCRGGMFPAADEAGRRAALDDNRRAVDEAAAHRRALPGPGRGRAAEGLARTSPARARRCATALAALLPYARAGRRAARDRAAASDVCRRPRLREHARRRRTISATSSATASASRSTSITSGGIPICARADRARRASASSPITSATGWCRPPTCCSTAA